MDGFRKLTQRITLLAGLWLLTGSSSGCLLLGSGYINQSILFSKF